MDETVARLAEAQSRTDAAVRALAEPQARTEAEFQKFREQSEERFARIEAAPARLSEAQAGLEERVSRLEEAVAKLTEAQARTEVALTRLSQQVGRLSNILGADLEVDAEEILRYALRQKGYRFLRPARPVEIDGEVDVVMYVEDPQGRRLWAVVEAKARVWGKEVERWSHRFKSPRFLQRLSRAGITGPYLPYIFGLRAYPDVSAAAQEAGVEILDFHGEQAEPQALA